MGLRKKLIQGEQGQVLVEFSFICVILLMLVGGVADGVTVMRYNIALHGAATEIVNQVSTTDEPAIYAICKDVVYINYNNNLGDGNTTYSCSKSIETVDSMLYKYHDYEHDYVHGVWSGNRAYIVVTVTLERNQRLITPFGQLIFGNAGGGWRNMKTTAQTRVYMDR